MYHHDVDVGLVANGATGWGFIGEISAQRLRPYTAGFAAASTCVVGVVFGVLVRYMVNSNQWNWGLKTCWLLAGLGLFFTLAMWFLIPETAGYVILDHLGGGPTLTLALGARRPNSTNYSSAK
jgi:hypothetical protein